MGESVRGLKVTKSALRWCRTCGTRHTGEDACPGELVATGPERHGWRACARRRHGTDVHGVLIAPVDDRWRARIVTYPNVLWMIPGGGGTSIKFVGFDPRDAEQQAIDFVEAHCKQKGHRLSHELPSVEPGFVDPEQDPKTEKSGFSRASRRKLHSMLVRYGVGRIRHASETSDVSERGLFITTDTPVPIGRILEMRLQIQESMIPMRGIVRWNRTVSHPGRPAGVGVEIIRPPAPYVRYVRELP